MLKPLFYFALLLSLLACSQQDTPDKYWQHAGSGALAANISNDGTLALVSSTAHGLILWDLTNNTQRHRWQQQGDNNLVLFTDISDNNKYAVSADKNSFVVWEVASGKALTFTKIRESAIRDIVIANNGQLLIGKVNGKVVHVDIFSGRRIEFLGHSEKINSVDLSPNGRYALSGGNDYSAILWNTKTGQVIQKFTHPSRVSKVVLDPKGRYAFTADSKKLSAIWDLKTGKEISRLQYMSRSRIFSAVSFSRDGTQLFTGNPGRLLNRWDIKTGNQLQQWQVQPRENSRPPSSVIYSIGEDKSGKLITESSSGYAEFWSYQKKGNNE
ncbi:MAG: PQQ-binding-like beta-propeller repeat protein [Gammaproteobacteria bacterium]|nr:PQQ-binding-like beta-propeller repeat protein [Gammaproteobacteria bacterium]